MFAAVCLFVVCILCGAMVLASIIESIHGLRHAGVGIAVYPLACLVSFGLAATAERTTAYIRSVAESGGVPPLLARALSRLRPIQVTSLSLMDVQLTAILLFVCYASTVVSKHLVDICRALKISSRRLRKA